MNQQLGKQQSISGSGPLSVQTAPPASKASSPPPSTIAVSRRSSRDSRETPPTAINRNDMAADSACSDAISSRQLQFQLASNNNDHNNCTDRRDNDKQNNVDDNHYHNKTGNRIKQLTIPNIFFTQISSKSRSNDDDDDINAETVDIKQRNFGTRLSDASSKISSTTTFDENRNQNGENVSVVQQNNDNNITEVTGQAERRLFVSSKRSTRLQLLHQQEEVYEQVSTSTISTPTSASSQSAQFYNEKTSPMPIGRRSNPASPKVDRRRLVLNITSSNNTLVPKTSEMSLNVSSNLASRRKLSLQPFGHMSPSDYLTASQQHETSLSPKNKHLSGSQTILYQQTPNGAGGGLAAGITSARNSIIDRLGRASFNAGRLSNVGAAFGQQLTANIGLKLPASQERIVEQTRWLYLKYVFVKLRQNLLPLRDLNITSRRSPSTTTQPLQRGLNPTLSPPTDSVTQTTTTTATIDTSLSAPVLPSTTVNPMTAARCRRRGTVNLNNLNVPLMSRNLQSPPTLASQIHDDKQSVFYKASVGTIKAQTAAVQDAAASQIKTSRKYLMDPTINNQIFAVIFNLTRELRELSPELYDDTVYKSIGIDKFSSLQSLLDAQTIICQEMIRGEISWCRIVALFSIFSSMSLDCVRLGFPDYVGPLLNEFISFFERDVAYWVSQQGGWESFLYKYRVQTNFVRMSASKLIICTLVIPLLVWLMLSMIN